MRIDAGSRKRRATAAATHARRCAALGFAVERLEPRRLFAQSIWAFPGDDGRMLYKPLPLGDHIGDYSAVGYMGGTAPIPDVAVKVTLNPVAGDNRAAIQAAIDAVGNLPLDAAGFRGAVLLNPGTYEISTGVVISKSGVVLRGSGQGQTILLGTGTEKDTVVRLDGSGTRTTVANTTKTILDKYVPVGAISFTVSDTANLAVGDTIIVHRPSTQNWIHDLGMDLLDNPWTQDGRDINMERTITRIDGNVVTINAPVTQALDLTYTDATRKNTIYKVTVNGRISNVGVEYVSGRSTFDPTLLSGNDRIDENHAENFVGVDGVINGWVRNVTSEYFGYACVTVTGNSKWVTVRDAQCLDPVSVVTGGRRYSFNIDDSVNCLFQNLYTRSGRHDFVQGSTVVGPNVFVDSRADNARADSGPHHRYSTGTLWDNIDENGSSGGLNIQNRGNSGTGHGWAGANMVVWNSEANSFVIQNPPTAFNWAIGGIGSVSNGSPGLGTQGIYDSHGTHVDTRSLYHAQLGERRGHENFVLREIRLGDADNYLSGDAADNVSVDATWKSSVQSATGKTGVGFDAVASGQLVPFTFTFPLDAGTYVIGASLSLGFKSANGASAADQIYIEHAGRAYTWAELGVAPPTATASGAVIDLSPFLAALQDGRLNLAIGGNTAIDWATLNFQTASVVQPTTTTLTPSADAYVQDGASASANFGSATTIQTKSDSTNNNRESFLKFDLSSLANLPLTEAYVRLVPTSVGVNATTFGNATGVIFNRLSFVPDDAWTEGGVTWNNRPSADPFFREFVSYLFEPVTVDVSSLVRAALAGDKTLSLRVSSAVTSATGQISFGSREAVNADFRPQLVVKTYNGYAPAADATVRDGSSASTNFGTTQDLTIRKDSGTNNGNNYESFLRFDLTGAPANPARATLRMMPLVIGTPTTPLSADFVSSDAWTETGVTWNTKPAGATVLGSTGAWQSQPSKFNVTTQAASTIAGDKLFSARLYSTTNSTAANVFASREWSNPSLRPLLVLTNLAPSITAIRDVQGTGGVTTAPQWFAVWDAETALASLTLTATSSNPTLLPAANVSFSGSGTDRTFTLTPAPGQTGSTQVTITVTDAQGLAASYQFLYTATGGVAPTVINGDQDAPNQPDTFRLVRNGTFLDVFRNNPSVPVLHVDYASSAPLVINLLGGDDTLLIDLTGGNPIPAAGLTIDAGAGADAIQLLGGAGNDAVALAAGTLSVAGIPASHSAFESMHVTLGAGADTLAASGNASVPGAAFTLLATGGGSLSLASGTVLPDFTDLTASAGTTFNLNGQSQTIDALDGAGTVLTNGAPAALTVGQYNASSAFAGTLANGSATLHLTKVGAGTLTLSGDNAYTGVTTISGGAIASGNFASLAALPGQVFFNGGTFRVTADTVAANVANKFTTTFTGATAAASTGTFDVAAGATLTIGGSNASLQTNKSGGPHGGRFTKTGAGALRIVGNNGQQDDPFQLNQGTVILESATALGGGDAGVRVDMKAGTTLVLRQDAATPFATPLNVTDALAPVSLVIDRLTPGPGVTHTLNTVTLPAGASLNLSAGPNVTDPTSPATLRVATTLSVNPSATLDLTDVQLILPYTGSSPLPALLPLIASAYAAGRWTGPGITSSLAAADPRSATGVGYADDGVQLRLRHTFFGDANLDARVSADDVATMLLAQSQNQTTWSAGNFNFDARVSPDDWALFAQGAAFQGPPAPSMASASDAASIAASLFSSDPLLA